MGNKQSGSDQATQQYSSQTSVHAHAQEGGKTMDVWRERQLKPEGQFSLAHDGRGVFVLVLSSNINNLPPESLTPPLNNLKMTTVKMIIVKLAVFF